MYANKTNSLGHSPQQSQLGRIKTRRFFCNFLSDFVEVRQLRAAQPLLAAGLLWDVSVTLQLELINRHVLAVLFSGKLGLLLGWRRPIDELA